MDKLRIFQLKSVFDEIVHFINSDDNREQVEIWFARELQEKLGYARWENFIVAIQRAVDSCKTQGINIDDHFREVTKMAELGSGAKREITDFLPTLTIAAKNLATEITNHNVDSRNLHGEQSITNEHIQNNKSVRNMLGERGIRPEDLPPADDIKKLERSVANDEKKIEKATTKLPKQQ
jgi:hypothetical protein